MRGERIREKEREKRGKNLKSKKPKKLI